MSQRHDRSAKADCRCTPARPPEPAPTPPPRRSCCGFITGELVEAGELLYVAAIDQLSVRAPFNVTEFRIGSPAPGVRSWIVVSGPVPNASAEPPCSGAVALVSVPRFGPITTPTGRRFEAQLNLLSGEPVPGRPDCMIATSEVVYVDAATGELVDPAVVIAASGAPFGVIHMGIFGGGSDPPLFATE